MTSVTMLNSISATSAASTASTGIQAASASSANASAELGKYESELSDWVHCPSSKTSQGKAKIAEITAKIASIKALVKQAETARQPASAHQIHELHVDQTQRPLRLDQLGTWIDTQA